MFKLPVPKRYTHICLLLGSVFLVGVGQFVLGTITAGPFLGASSWGHAGAAAASHDPTLGVCIKMAPVANWLDVSDGEQRADAARRMEDRFAIEGSEPAAGSNAVLARRSEALRAALCRFFQRHIRDSSEVDDLVQEVFLRVVRRGHCDQLEHLDGYIFQTAASV